jgi:hypothetical protein
MVLVVNQQYTEKTPFNFSKVKDIIFIKDESVVAQVTAL